MELMRVLKVDESELYVPVDIPDMKAEKNGWEMAVTVMDPWRFHTISESYNCSATARVERYQGCSGYRRR